MIYNLLFSGSVASKIMARMGYRVGQGLGRMEQGMSIALQVEKTSKRGGKIIHEKDIAKRMFSVIVSFLSFLIFCTCA